MKRKTIRLSMEAYNALVVAKRPGESFSDVVIRLCKAYREGSQPGVPASPR